MAIVNGVNERKIKWQKENEMAYAENKEIKYENINENRNNK